MYTASVMLLVAIIAALNLCMGYATALIIGHGPKLKPGSVLPDLSLFEQQPGKADAPAQAPREKTVEKEPATQPETSEPEPEPPPAPPKRIVSPIESSIQKIKKHTAGQRDDLLELDERLRACTDMLSLQAVQDCANELTSVNQRYLKQQANEVEKLAGREKKSPELAPSGEQTRRAAEEQMEVVQEALDGLKNFETKEETLQKDHQRLISQTGRLIESCHTVRESIDDSLLQLARQQQVKEEDQNTAWKVTEEMELTGRAGLEAVLEDWWQGDPERSRQLSVGMIDVDQLGEINEKHGPAVGDRILQGISMIVSTAEQDGAKVNRFAGQQFLLMFPDTSPQETTGAVERIRQSVQKTTFDHVGEEILMTVSCAVLEAKADDTVTQMLERIDSTIQEAKRYGRNRTFLFEEDYPTPVVPPSITVDQRVMTI